MTENMRVRIRIGDVEVEFEGDESFLDNGLQEILDSVVALHGKFGGQTAHTTNGDERIPGGGPPGYDGTLQTWAAKLGVKTGPELIVAALGRMHLVDGVATTSRVNLIKQMQAAPQYYKSSYVSNLTANLKSLIKSDRVREISHEVYALSASELEKVRAAYDS